MNEEEQEAIESLRIKAEYIGENYSFGKQGIRNLKKDLKIVLNLISRLQKELDKKDKVIDKMAKTIAGLQLYDFGRKEYFTLEDEGEVREYFYKKAEEENES